MIRLLRWGRSAYETDRDLADEEARLAKLGVSTSRYEGAFPPISGVHFLAVTSGVRVTAKLFDQADALRMVVTTTSGAEHIDVAAAEARGVLVARCPLARRDAVVDSSVAMALSLLRALPYLNRRAAEGVWARGELPALAPRTAMGAVVGLVGLGVIGLRAQELWRALGARVLFSDPRVAGSSPLHELLEHADILSLHCSLTGSAETIIDARALARMKPGMILINTARGRCVDVSAALASERVAGLGLDVFPQEPPEDLAALAAHPKVIVAPHAAGFHPQLGAAVAVELASAVAAVLAGGEPPHPVRAADQRPTPGELAESSAPPAGRTRP